MEKSNSSKKIANAEHLLKLLDIVAALRKQIEKIDTDIS